MTVMGWKYFSRFITIKWIFITIFIVYIGLFSAKALVNKKTIYGDGRYYYSWLRSIIIDHDINFQNEYSFYNITEPNTKFNTPRNVYSIGPAIFWTQAFVWVHQIFRSDGFMFPYQFAVGFGDVLAVIAGLGILYRLLTRYFNRRISLLTIVSIAFATNLFFYGSLDTVNSHSISFFIATIVLTLFLTRRSPLLLGVFIGLLSLVRSQDAVFLFLVLPSLNFIEIAQGIGGFIIGFSPQLIAWQALYGTFTKSPYIDQDHYFDIFHPKLPEVLFSPNNGLFFWTPILIFSVVGLFLSTFPKQVPKLLFLAIIIVAWYAIASWSFWWQGASYSGRMFVSLLPFLAFGLGSFLSNLTPKKQLLFVGFFSILNTATMFIYLILH